LSQSTVPFSPHQQVQKMEKFIEVENVERKNKEKLKTHFYKKSFKNQKR